MTEVPYYADCGWLPFGWGKKEAENVGVCGSKTELKNGQCQVADQSDQYANSGVAAGQTDSKCRFLMHLDDENNENWAINDTSYISYPFSRKPSNLTMSINSLDNNFKCCYRFQTSNGNNFHSHDEVCLGEGQAQLSIEFTSDVYSMQLRAKKI